MKSSLLVLLVCVACLEGFELVRQQSANAAFQRQIGELRASIAAKPKPPTLEEQQRCSQGAEALFKSQGYDKESMAGVESHFNTALGRCFVKIESLKVLGAVTWTYKTVADAFERKVYGDYAWHTEKDKKYWEVPPFMCKFTKLDGADAFCKSPEEFDEAMKVYMGPPGG